MAFILFLFCLKWLPVTLRVGHPGSWVNVIYQTFLSLLLNTNPFLGYTSLLLVSLCHKKVRDWKGRSLKIVFSFLLLKLSNMNSSRESSIMNSMYLTPPTSVTQLFANLVSSFPVSPWFFFLPWAYFKANSRYHLPGSTSVCICRGYLSIYLV